ncbi:MAG: phosphoribosyltransferase [Sphingobacteriales bacterium]|nr:MAG: phosphoribosyltransferase [Sphingobacteriales bacterium]
MKRELILDKNQIQQKINRIAFQILEDNFEEKEVIIAGVWARGYRFAIRLQSVLQKICEIKITVSSILLDKESINYDASTDIKLINLDNKVVILVDDVLSSGRNLALGSAFFLKSPIKKLRTSVLINRSHKLFPIATDFVGLELSTVLKEHVQVILNENNEKDAVYLI